LTPFFIGGSVLCAPNIVVRSSSGRALLSSFCSPETRHFQENSSFSFFNQKSPNQLNLGNQKYTCFLDQLINYVSLISSMNSNQTTTFAAWISRFCWWKTIIFWKYWVSGLQNEHNIACPKNDLTKVFLAQRTAPPIKNGAIVLILSI